MTGIYGLKNLVIHSGPYWILRNFWRRCRAKQELTQWEMTGSISPPPHIVKQNALRALATEYKLSILVETGTYFGDMVVAMKDHFAYVYSIELSEKLYECAKKRFARDRNVVILHGDSGERLGEIVEKINGPALYWLDGHFSSGFTAQGHKDTPIFKELKSIFEQGDKRSVVVIDDARLFGSDPSYPSKEELEKVIRGFDGNWVIEVKWDAIRITPRS